VVRDLLADPDVAVTIRRLVTDPLTGHLLDYGRKTYEVPQRLREFLIARGGCQILCVSRWRRYWPFGAAWSTHVCHEHAG
jgi:hypothetical protein